MRHADSSVDLALQLCDAVLGFDGVDSLSRDCAAAWLRRKELLTGQASLLDAAGSEALLSQKVATLKMFPLVVFKDDRAYGDYASILIEFGFDAANDLATDEDDGSSWLVDYVGSVRLTMASCYNTTMLEVSHRLAIISMACSLAARLDAIVMATPLTAMLETGEQRSKRQGEEFEREKLQTIRRHVETCKERASLDMPGKARWCKTFDVIAPALLLEPGTYPLEFRQRRRYTNRRYELIVGHPEGSILRRTQ